MPTTGNYFHLHLVSDSTGETLITVARAVAAQYANVTAVEHVYPLVRSQKQLDRVLEEIEEAPGIVLFTLLEKDLVGRLEAKCQQINIPSLSIIGPVMQLFQAYLGAPTTGRVGAQHTLNSLKGKNGAVIIFIATRCPVSNGYNDRMEKLAQDYQAKGINVIGINSNSTEPASEVKTHAAEKHLTFAILKDDGNKIADRFGANHTPEAYVIDASGKLVYHGRIDNSQNTANITSNDLREALDAVLAGMPIQKTTSVAFGCSIKRVS